MILEILGALSLGGANPREIIQLMDNRLLESILDELHNAKYFSISVDSTPDLSYVDQLTAVVRFVLKTMHGVKEYFISSRVLCLKNDPSMSFSHVCTFLHQASISLSFHRL